MVDNKRKTTPNVVKEAITPPISEKRILTQSTEQRNHKNPIKVDTTRINKTEKVKSIDK